MGRSRKPKDKRSEIIKSFGGLHNFMICYGVKPWDLDAREEAEHIIEALIDSDDDSGAEGSEGEGNSKSNEETEEDNREESEISDEDEKEDRERAGIIKGYGGIKSFMESDGFIPWEAYDYVMAENTTEAMMFADEPSKNNKETKKESDWRKGEGDKLKEKMAKIINRSGGIEDFMLENGLLPWEPHDYDEAKELVEAMIDNEEYELSGDESDCGSDGALGESSKTADKEEDDVWEPKSKRNKIIKSYGGMTNFMITYGFRPWDPEAYDVVENIIEDIIRDMEEEEDKKEKENKKVGNAKETKLAGSGKDPGKIQEVEVKNDSGKSKNAGASSRRRRARKRRANAGL